MNFYCTQCQIHIARRELPASGRYGLLGQIHRHVRASGIKQRTADIQRFLMSVYFIRPVGIRENHRTAEFIIRLRHFNLRDLRHENLGLPPGHSSGIEFVEGQPKRLMSCPMARARILLISNGSLIISTSFASSGSSQMNSINGQNDMIL